MTTGAVPPARRGPSRRAALGAVGVGIGAGALGATAGAAAAQVTDHDRPPPVTGFTVDDWVRHRGQHYLIAHRGSGDVFPEHSLEAYRAALQWGARCLEVSVGMTSDGVLICQHDTTYDRTTTITGPVSTQPSTILRSAGIRMPQLGPAWTQPPLPKIPTLDQALRVLGSQAVICLEAKVDAAYPVMLDLVARLGLTDTVIVKAFRGSERIAQAQRAGYPVFSYLGPGDLTDATIAAAARPLRAARDYLVVPAAVGGTPLTDTVLSACLSHHVPVWVYPVHRRAELDYYFSRGVAGAVCSSFGYLGRATPVATADTWRSKAIAPGEMTRRPAEAAWAPAWTGTDEITLSRPGAQQFLTLGQLCPVASAGQSYRVQFEARWNSLPADATGTVNLAFAFPDDSYYEQGHGRKAGYHAEWRVDGRLSIHRDDADSTTSVELASVRTPRARVGDWTPLSLTVSPPAVSWTRDGPPPVTVTATDPAVRGGYLHLGRTSVDGAVSLRRLRIG